MLGSYLEYVNTFQSDYKNDTELKKIFFLLGLSKFRNISVCETEEFI